MIVPETRHVTYRATHAQTFFASERHRGKMSAHAPLRTHLIHLIRALELLSSLFLSLFGGEGKVLLDLLMIKISRSTWTRQKN